jgi:hypothetical protein
VLERRARWGPEGGGQDVADDDGRGVALLAVDIQPVEVKWKSLMAIDALAVWKR